MLYHQLSSGIVFSNYEQTQQNQLEKRLENSSHPKIEVSSLNQSNCSLSSEEQLSILDRSTTPATILIVDDNPDNLQVLFSYLEMVGFKVLLAEDSQSAIQIAQSQNPDLILLDILMPGVNGFATCSQLKSQASTKDIPVIFLTALSDTIDKVEGFKRGGVDYITKPIEQEEVLVRIQTHLRLRNMDRALVVQNRELKNALEFEASVRRIANKIRDTLDETYCLRVATKELATVLHLSSCQIELYDAKQKTATIAHEHSVSIPQSLGETRQVDEFAELYQQLLQKSPLQLVEPVPQFSPQGIQVTRLACPIFDERGIIGNLWGLRPPGELFTPLETRLMEQVASQCAIAMRQARLYANSNQQVAELAKLNQLKDNFLKTVSRELKAPISSIQLAAQTLESLLKAKQNPSQSPLFKRVLKIFHESCQQQKKLTDDILTLCYIDARAKVIQPESLELNALINNLVKPYLARKNQQQLLVELSRQKLNIYVDPSILEQIVNELLNNAFQYTPTDADIILQTELLESNALIRMINLDREISKTEQQQIFEQFYHSSIKATYHRGSGLGLTLVKKLVDVLDASIDVVSDRQRTTFTITIPLEL